MVAERKFIRKALNELKIKEFIVRELERAGMSSIIIQKTPVATRVILYVRRPQAVVGKGGKGIRDLCEKLENNFGVENPQVEVVEVESPELDAQLMAHKLAKQIELRGAPKRLIRFSLHDIMNSGAIGAEIRIAGKVIGKGAKARVLTARAGYLKKSGMLDKFVRVGRATAYPRAGAIGVTVKIIPPGTVFSERSLSEKLAARVKEEDKAAVAAAKAAALTLAEGSVEPAKAEGAVEAEAEWGEELKEPEEPGKETGAEEASGEGAQKP
jgi:small subunit ribosomal protein S3